MKRFRKMYRIVPLIIALYNAYQGWFYDNLSSTLVYLTLISVLLVVSIDALIKKTNVTEIN